MIMFRHRLAAGTAAAALLASVGLALPAQAFENSAWSWDTSVTDSAVSDRNSWMWAFPDGQATVDELAVSVGNFGASVALDAQVMPPDLDGSSTTVTPVPADAELGLVVGSAGAFGNVQTVSAEVPVDDLLGQFHFGGFGVGAAADPATTLTTLDDVTASATATNPNRALVDTLSKEAMLGMITPHQTTATVDAVGVTDTAVELEAQAISNSASLTLAAAPAEPATLGEGGTLLDGAEATAYPLSTNAILTGDLTQFTYGDSSAAANAGQTLTNFSGLGSYGGPIANVGTTAIGNLTTVNAGFSDGSVAN